MTDTRHAAGLMEDETWVDLLKEKKDGCDLSHACRPFNPQTYSGASHCTTAELNAAVLESHFLHRVATEVAMETGVTVKEVKEEARSILEEMSQNLQLGFVRLMGFVLTKVLKRIFTGVFFNMDGLNTLQQAVKENPVILMPNHRSYVDFLVISYILFTYDIPLPVIAAGIPLAGMSIVGEILRRSGAFFIRRSIGSDKLYWAVLSEYVRSIVRGGFAPVEFYVEGLRSRTLKSLTPKLGMMQMVLEPYFKSEVFDITLVPISISYDRVLEESLLVHELLGVPKPKESTAGLLKASRVLQEDYGSMHVNFGRPLSVRQLCEGRINRGHYNLIPRDLVQSPTAQEQACVSWIAHRVVRLQEQGSLLGPWPLMACLLLRAPAAVLTGEGLPWRQLREETLWLRRLALDFGALLKFPEPSPGFDEMSSAVELHRSVVQRKEGRIYLVEEERDIPRKHPLSPEEGVLRTAAPLLMLAAYQNQCLHIFVRPAMLAVAARIAGSTQRDELLAAFCFLQVVFSNEFIFVPGRSHQDFEEACSLLEKCGAVQADRQEVTVAPGGQEVFSFLQELLQPFIHSYQLIFQLLCDEGVQVLTEKHFLPTVRNKATNLILSGDLGTYEALSSDTQKNALSALRRLEAATKLRASEQNEYKVNLAAVRRIGDALSGKIPPQMLQATPDARL
ncbi:dihydroxyacetone phosphate acyltransferase-like [Salarias fasciatus]|uniref:dihydroxyacetone phosphate acyltransferase-like n=1 Tax=Salarias fasciatus TaxID=181472 RepID=UPI0011769BA0|nr:dihydroxyacetone phosphate acyltransferase-like [Salarias fasciatus]XP_029966608.1 dihydroxyacetone phosphate acyltransferase-like [Salarias fasciatus]